MLDSGISDDGRGGTDPSRDRGEQGERRRKWKDGCPILLLPASRKLSIAPIFRVYTAKHQCNLVGNAAHLTLDLSDSGQSRVREGEHTKQEQLHPIDFLTLDTRVRVEQY